jgi:RNA polymerase sigma-70 factor (ECF subfamily)
MAHTGNDHNYQYEPNDATLVAQFRSGEREAFDLLLMRYAPSVLRLCTRLLGTSAEAQDVAQEAALQAFLGLDHLQDPARFGAWFHAIAANLARSQLRRRARLPLTTVGADPSTRLLWSNAAPTVDEIHAAREIHDAILDALGDLSVVNRQAVIGFYLEGYTYTELARLLGVSVSTVKGRLFEGRRHLKRILQPLGDALLQPSSTQRKENRMTDTITAASELVELQIDSVRMLLLTRQRFVILREEQSRFGLLIRLSLAEAEALSTALDIQRDEGGHAFPQNLSQRLLESLTAHVERIVVNALAEQAFYATLTLVQGGQTHELDVRLSDALALAVHEKVPMYATRALLDAAAHLDLSTGAADPTPEEVQAWKTNQPGLGREERMRREEVLHQAITRRRRSRPDDFSERLWAFLLEELTDARDDVSIGELRALDLPAVLQAHEVTWEGQAMVALHIPEQQASSWMLVPPKEWRRLDKAFKGLQNTEQIEQPTPVKPVPDVLPVQIQQQVEASLSHLLEESTIRTVFLLNPHGALSAWKGPDTEDVILKFSQQLSLETTRQNPLANEHELERQLGHQPQRASGVGDEKAIREFPAHIGGVIGSMIYHDWKLVVLCKQEHFRERRGEVKERVIQATRELHDLISQA